MKKGIHPEMFDISARCACGYEINTRSVIKAIKTTICAQCHPFYTGAQKFVDTAGRIEKFNKKYKNVVNKV